MASLKKRGATYYVVFTRRVEGRLEQKAFSLGVSRRDHAERLQVRYEDRYQLGEIDPFNGWSPKQDRKASASQGGNGVPFKKAADAFLKSRSHVRERTRSEYEAQVRRLTEHIGATMPVRLVAEEDVRSYAFRPSLSTASRTTYLRFCRMLFRWLAENGYVERDVAARIRYPKRNDRTSDKTISAADLTKVFSEHRKAERARGGALLHPWFRPMMATFFYAGLRAREGVALTWEKVSLEGRYIRITGTKSGRERTVPIRDALYPHLASWHRYNGSPASGVVFYGSARNERRSPLDPGHVSKTFKRYALAADLPDSVNLHGLRHSCATELLRAGLGINYVRLFLGHASIDTTTIYEHLSEHDLAERIRAISL